MNNSKGYFEIFTKAILNKVCTGQSLPVYFYFSDICRLKKTLILSQNTFKLLDLTKNKTGTPKKYAESLFLTIPFAFHQFELELNIRYSLGHWDPQQLSQSL